MAQQANLQVATRIDTGKGAARSLRRAGKVPAVLYGHGTDSVSLSVDARDLRHALTGDAGLNALLSLQVDGSSHLAMARQLQRDPVKGSLDHVDFVIVRRDEFDHGVRQVLEEGMAGGVFAQGDPKLLAFAMFGAVNWIPRWFNPEGPATSQEIADRFAEYLIAGLRAGL